MAKGKETTAIFGCYATDNTHQPTTKLSEQIASPLPVDPISSAHIWWCIKINTKILPAFCSPEDRVVYYN